MVVSLCNLGNSLQNGEEFENEVYKELCKQFNIEFVTTAAGIPWLNGTCEQHNRVIKEMIFENVDNTGCL